MSVNEFQLILSLLGTLTVCRWSFVKFGLQGLGHPWSPARTRTRIVNTDLPMGDISILQENLTLTMEVDSLLTIRL